MPNKLVILDRDGVINIDSDDYIKSVEEWLPIPGSIEAIARLSQAGYSIIIVSNQSGLARGLFTEFDLAIMHNYMQSLVEDAGGHIDAIFYCPHLPADNCSCRKPRPGMLQQIENEFLLSLKNVYFVGDTLKDIEAALSMSCLPILVRTGKGNVTSATLSDSLKEQVKICDDLSSAVTYILD
jgi:D-glycero-D-manno-heptose 1,7-bisphosphate phosphatase